MDSTYIEITIDGQTYYVPADRLSDIQYINGKLVNASNSSITIVSGWSTETIYPRITANAMQQLRFYRTSGTSYTGVTSNYTITGNRSIYQLGSNGLLALITFILIITLGARLIWKR